LQIDNKREPVPLYKIEGSGVNNETIYVTGSHLVLDKLTNKFVKTMNYSKAKLSNEKTDIFCCLITSNHKIVVGSETFWDWEDHFIKYRSS
jgi:hypothetical protein